MEQWFAVSVHIRGELRDVLQVAFRGYRLRQAYDLPYRDCFTDDASVMEAAGFGNLKLTEGSSHNIKITNPGDIAIAEVLMKLNKEQ